MKQGGGVCNHFDMEDPSAKPHFAYYTYGLRIRSDIRLPELVVSEPNRDPDVNVTTGHLDEARLDFELDGAETFMRLGCVVRSSPKAVCYSWQGIGTVLILNGSEVVVSIEPGTDEADLAPFITGAVFGNLLHQRGLMILHGSSVAVGGKAVAFLGEKEAGKSTTALHLHARGYPLLTDDLLPLEFGHGEIRTIPGFPQIKLCTDTLEAAGLEPAALPRINRFVDKRAYRCTDGFVSEPMRISRLYILTEGPKIAIQRLDPSEAFIEIVRNTYLHRYLQATGRTATHFKRCEAVVETLPIFRLSRPRQFHLLPEVSTAVIDHQV